jgi:HEAT repeat protein
MILLWMVLVSGTLLPARTQVDRAWSILTDGVAEQSAEKRRKAVQALGLLPSNVPAQRMAEKILQTNEKPEVRAAAATALGQMGAKSSAVRLKAALNDVDAEVVLASASSLFLLRDPVAYEVYYAVLIGERKSGVGLLDSHIKNLKDPKFVAKMGVGFIPFGGIGYEVYKAFAKDDTSSVRAAAAQKLARDPDLRSGDALAQASSDNKWLVRAAAVDALARRGDPAFLPTAVLLLDDENDTVRYNAAAAVVRLSMRASAGSGNLKREQR